ncbi:hypothetical protein GYH30_041296 [Glycine max]|uniref:Uncharacterized protein n=2 Tax=Glycine subgen. Soja TaxID=1462606 RepID=A0A0R0FVV6_SOYBN|nr:hypothetical protein GYH30_041296 [Glycine max]RZB62987.1 hypothetical protein D0Y65_039926 [Glycine soja]
MILMLGFGWIALRGIIPPSLRMISIHRRLRSSILPTLRRRFGSLKFPAKWNRIWKLNFWFGLGYSR